MDKGFANSVKKGGHFPKNAFLTGLERSTSILMLQIPSGMQGLSIRGMTVSWTLF